MSKKEIKTTKPNPSSMYGSTFQYESTRPNERLAKCTMCNKETYSHPGLPFFFFILDQPKDRYYCGCHGFD